MSDERESDDDGVALEGPAGSDVDFDACDDCTCVVLLLDVGAGDPDPRADPVATAAPPGPAGPADAAAPDVLPLPLRL